MTAHDTNSDVPDIELELLSQARLLAPVREMLNCLMRRTGFEDCEAGKVSLAVEEALCNIINHGYEKKKDGRIWLKVWTNNSPTPSVRILLEDEAKQVDPDVIKSRPLEEIRPGGLGVHIIREVMDEVSYEKRESEGMRLVMSKQASQK